MGAPYGKKASDRKRANAESEPGPVGLGLHNVGRPGDSEAWDGRGRGVFMSDYLRVCQTCSSAFRIGPSFPCLLST